MKILYSNVFALNIRWDGRENTKEHLHCGPLKKWLRKVMRKEGERYCRDL